jgi:transposase
MKFKLVQFYGKRRLNADNRKSKENKNKIKLISKDYKTRNIPSNFLHTKFENKASLKTNNGGNFI